MLKATCSSLLELIACNISASTLITTPHYYQDQSRQLSADSKHLTLHISGWESFTLFRVIMFMKTTPFAILNPLAVLSHNVYREPYCSSEWLCTNSHLCCFCRERSVKRVIIQLVLARTSQKSYLDVYLVWVVGVFPPGHCTSDWHVALQQEHLDRDLLHILELKILFFYKENLPWNCSYSLSSLLQFSRFNYIFVA